MATASKDTPQQFCVRWNSYQSNLQSAFPKLLTNEHFVDVTLACESRMVKCHKVVLSACSAYFEKLLVQNPCQHPIIFMKDMKYWEVQALVDFMYKGEVNVTQDELASLLKAAEALEVRGLCGQGEPGAQKLTIPRISTDVTTNEQKKRRLDGGETTSDTNLNNNNSCNNNNSNNNNNTNNNNNSNNNSCNSTSSTSSNNNNNINQQQNGGDFSTVNITNQHLPTSTVNTPEQLKTSDHSLPTTPLNSSNSNLKHDYLNRYNVTKCQD